MDSEKNNLLDFVASMGGDRSLRVEENLGSGFVRLRVAEAERRQAKHDIRYVEDIVVEMLRNARDAHATKIFLATSKEGDLRTITMLDNGDGVPKSMFSTIFDARVTSKLETIHMDKWGVHGRGMALYSIKENCESAQVLDSDEGCGSSFQVIADTTKLVERKDQSTWPQLGIDEDGNQSLVRGPHNILRTCCDFALEERNVCDVYVGSAAEIVATIRKRVSAQSMSSTDLLFIDDLNQLPLLERLSAASDSKELVEVACRLGLDLSERTAYRILAGQIKAQRSVCARLLHKASGLPAEVDLTKDQRGLKLSKDDMAHFSHSLEKNFDYLAQRYYLQLSDSPKIRVSNDKITVTFKIEEQD